MTNLTEQWKRGELEDGYYYVKIKGDEEYMLSREDEHWYEFGWDCWFFDSDIVEILAEIPSYEKYKCLETGIILADILIKNTKEENQKLKELLKECVEVLNDAQRNYGYDDSIIDICSPIITKIDEEIKK